MAFAKVVSGLLSVATVSAVVVACSGGNSLPPLEGLDGSSTVDPNTQPGGNETICLLNNCDTDRHCQNCSGGRSTCNQKEHRCVACGPEAAGKACSSGQACTKYGDCVAGNAACAEGADGVPTISCNGDADCAACGPDFKVCDPGSRKCVGCTATNLTNCQTTDICKAGKCEPACPAACATDTDCSQCGGKNGAPANMACNRGVCAKCSDTKKCPGANETCNDVGECEKVCGLALNPGRCNTDGDCASCMGGLTRCGNKPIAGGPGTCLAPAAGCSDLGKGVVVLPDPFSRVTQTCSVDGDCAGIKASLNVGGLIKRATGLNVGDASLDYPMNACASVDILDGKKCGVCVPCKKDLDCQPIDVQKFAGQAFGPIGSIAAALLLDRVFGPSDRKVHMYCQMITGGYGACVPCPSFFQRCGDSAAGEEKATLCPHDVCTIGPALGPTCDTGCAGQVAAKDAFCGSVMGFWDQRCRALVETECRTKTCVPVSCVAPKTAGWYCNEQNKNAGYRCGGDGTPGIAEGFNCAPVSGQTTYCHRTDPTDLRSKAILDTNGRPRCFPTQQP